MGFQRSRESFNSELGPAFDPATAAATASNMTFSILLHPERVSRLILYKSLNDKQLSLSELLDTMIEHSFKIDHKEDYQREVQNMINEQLLQNMFSLAGEQHDYFQVNAITITKLNELADYLNTKKSKGEQALVDRYMIQSIREFLKNSEKKREYQQPKLPDGSPIGMD